MKITLIGPTYPYKGGISHFTTILAKELRKDHTVNFLSWKRQYPSFLYPVELKDTKSKNPIKVEASYNLDFYNPFSWIQAFLSLRKFGTDLLILTWASPIQAPIYGIIGFLARHFAKAKVLYICHNVLPHEKTSYDVPLLKFAFSQGDYFMVHAKEDKKKLESLVKNKKIIQGYLPIFDMFPETNIKKEELKKKYHLNSHTLLFFGYIRPYKGLTYLLKAMPDILQNYPSAQLLVVGQFWSKDKEKYLQLVDTMKLHNNIHFVDHYVPDEEIGAYFDASDVVVLPYIEATQSASIQTAYAFNKPVISTTVGGLGDVVEDRVTGYVIKPKDPKDIAEKVNIFYKHPIPEKNIEKAKEKFGWEKYTQLLLNQ